MTFIFVLKSLSKSALVFEYYKPVNLYEYTLTHSTQKTTNKSRKFTQSNTQQYETLTNHHHDQRQRKRKKNDKNLYLSLSGLRRTLNLSRSNSEQQVVELIN